MDKWKMVPVEPDENMEQAAMYARDHALALKWTFADCYKAMLAAAPAPAFDEAAERAAFEEWAHAQWPGAQRQQLELGEGGRYKNPIYRDMLVGWLACARSKAGVL